MTITSNHLLFLLTFCRSTAYGLGTVGTIVAMYGLFLTPEHSPLYIHTIAHGIEYYLLAVPLDLLAAHLILPTYKDAILFEKDRLNTQPPIDLSQL